MRRFTSICSAPGSTWLSMVTRIQLVRSTSILNLSVKATRTAMHSVHPKPSLRLRNKRKEQTTLKPHGTGRSLTRKVKSIASLASLRHTNSMHSTLVPLILSYSPTQVVQSQPKVRILVSCVYLIARIRYIVRVFFSSCWLTDQTTSWLLIMLFDSFTFCVHEIGAFANYHLWVTPHSDTERYPSGEYTVQGTGTNGLPDWTAGDRNIKGDDVVLWHAFGVTHVPRPEDFPVMPCEITGFSLKPDSFFEGNPAIDLEPEVNEASKLAKGCCST